MDNKFEHAVWKFLQNMFVQLILWSAMSMMHINAISMASLASQRFFFGHLYFLIQGRVKTGKRVMYNFNKKFMWFEVSIFNFGINFSVEHIYYH